MVAAAEVLITSGVLSAPAKTNTDWLALGVAVLGGAGFANYIRTEMRSLTAGRARIIQTATEKGLNITGRIFKHIRPTPVV